MGMNINNTSICTIGMVLDSLSLLFSGAAIFGDAEAPGDVVSTLSLPSYVV